MNHRRTVTQLLSYLNKVYKAEKNFDNCLTVYPVVIKTFDSFSLGLLIHKVSPFGHDISSCLSEHLIMSYQSEAGC